MLFKKERKIIFDNNIQIAFYITKDERGKIYTLHMNNNEENFECLMLTISKNTKITDSVAEINIINNDQNCKSMDDLYTLNGKNFVENCINEWSHLDIGCYNFTNHFFI